MKILITGYSGFVGSHILDELKNNFKISLLGRTDPPIDTYFLKAPLDAYSDYSSILVGIDVVLHVAARVHIINETAKNPLEDFRSVNVKGTINLAEQAAKNGVKRFIFISSVKVNGENTTLNRPFTQSDDRNPTDYYGISKLEAEEQIEILSEQTGMEYVFIRPPLVYGYGVKANFSALMRLVGCKLPLPFRTFTFNSRSFVSVYNLVDLIKVCIKHPNASNQTFLVSDDDDLSTSEMVRLMAKVQSVKPILFPVPIWIFKLLGKLTGNSDMISRLTDSLLVDITHTKETLGWKPPFSVEEGFAKCVEKNKGKKRV